MLYEVAILERPTPKGEENGAPELLVFGPKAVVARDRDAAIATAVHDANLTADPNRLEVLVRPFADESD